LKVKVILFAWAGQSRSSIVKKMVSAQRYPLILPLLLLTLSLGSAAEHAQNPKAVSPSVIYGGDGRTDLYLVNDPRLKRAAQSIALVIDTQRDLKQKENHQLLYFYQNGARHQLCSQERFYHQPVTGHCTAVLIAPDRVLTSKHCVSDLQQCRRTGFVFDYAVNSKSEEEVKNLLPTINPLNPARISYCQAIISKGSEMVEVNDQNRDFIIVTISPKQLSRPTLPLSAQKAPLSPKQPLALLGHPLGLPLKIAADTKVKIFSSTTPSFIVESDSFEGNSGSALIDLQQGTLVGMLSGGERDFTEKQLPGGERCFASRRCYPGSDCKGEVAIKVDTILNRK
jgi:hypothetical protein